MTNSSTALALAVGLIAVGSAALAQGFNRTDDHIGYYGLDGPNFGPGIAPADRHLNLNGNWGYYVRGGHFDPPRGFSDVSGPSGTATYVLEPDSLGRSVASAMNLNSREVMQIRRRQALQARQHHRASQIRQNYRYR